MPVTFYALESGRILYVRIVSPWTVDDLIATYPLQKPYFDQASGRVHSLYDMLEMRAIPKTPLRGRFSPGLFHKSSGYVVVVGADSSPARMLTDLSFRLMGKTDYRYATSFESGLAFLKREIAIEHNLSMIYQSL